MTDKHAEMDFLCAVLDALPCPAALLDSELEAAYVNSRPCPVPLEDVSFSQLQEIRMAQDGSSRPAERTRLETPSASCFGLLEIYPVLLEDYVAGILVLFRPEYALPELTPDALPTRSPAMDAVWNRLHRMSLLSSPVVFIGEKGLGAEDFAAALHRMGSRRTYPFHKARPPHTEGELAEDVRAAGGGTLLCPDLDHWDTDMLSSLCRLLEIRGLTDAEGRFTERRCRVMMTASPDAPPDIFERLGAVLVTLPPLRERREDILPAARALCRHFTLKLDKDVQGFTLEAREVLQSHPWTGNLDQLWDAVEQAVQACPGGLILASHLPGAPEMPSAAPLQVMKSAYQREQIQLLLQTYGQTVEGKKRAARELGIGLSTLYRLLK